MKTAKCGRCGYADTMRRQGVDGADVLPGAWTMVSVTVKPIVNLQLCPSCTRRVLDTLRHPEWDLPTVAVVPVELSSNGGGGGPVVDLGYMSLDPQSVESAS